MLSATLFFGLTVHRTAHAGTFDEGGRFHFDDRAIARESFADGRGQKAIKIVSAGDAIDGVGYGTVDSSTEQFTIPVAVPKQDAAYRARMFARKNRAVASINVGYPADGGAPGFYARFFPTGLVTSDGWYELATAPFSVQASRGATSTLTLFGNGVDVDAFELVPEGTFAPISACKPPVDSACRANEQCIAGFCRDGNLALPPLPPARDRADVVSYFQNRMRYFFGGRYTRGARLPIALATLDRARDAGTGWEFWNGLVMAIRQLHDWHTTMNGPSFAGGRGALPVCFVEGDADLSHGIAPKDGKYPDVLVSHVGTQKTSGLLPGDRLVAVNGMHPIAFAETLEGQDWGMWRANDPGTTAEPVERIGGLIRRYADNFTVIRCNAGVCGAPEVISVATLPDGNVQSPYCDHRPGYHLASGGPDPIIHDSYNGPFHGLLADSQSGEDLYGMIWNDVSLEGNGNPYSESMDEFRAKAKGVVLDHRLGNGGTEPAAEYLTQLFRAPATLAAWGGFHLTTNLYDDPFTPSDGVSLYTLFLNTEPYKVGSSSARTTGMPTALLIARDGSASDWFPLGMVGLNNVRVFGRQTAGAFSSFIEFDYYGSLAWRMASGDLLEPDGKTRIGRGVVPTEEVLPKQSDLAFGKDTAYLRALEWIRTCVGCK
ncbi:hypothetical protein BH09MYX1_BH09MYX1_51140 [soil metagenome]